MKLYECLLIDHKKKKGVCEMPKNIMKRQKKSMPSTSKPKTSKSKQPYHVQKLFQTCKEVFAKCEPGTVPSPEDVQRLQLVLDDMKPVDVGLTQDMLYFSTIKNDEAPPITYLHLYDCNRFSIGIFCLPSSGVIPLHNHPGMTVFSKLLSGSMHIKSYDWVTHLPSTANENFNPSYFQPPGVRLAKVTNDATFTAPCSTSILYPTSGGNMHCFTARTPCAVLDVLGPPYSDPEGRHCTYYKDFPYADFSGFIAVDEIEGYAWLEEKDKPADDFSVVGDIYRGPKIVET